MHQLIDGRARRALSSTRRWRASTGALRSAQPSHKRPETSRPTVSAARVVALVPILVPIPVLILVAGCAASPPPLVNTVAFEPREAAHIDRAGDGAIVGEAFLRRPNGRITTCAGLTVSLVPASAYAADRIRQIYGSPDGGAAVYRARGGDDPDPAYLAMIRSDRCDARGQFAFENVAAGVYYVTTSVTWTRPSAGVFVVDPQVFGALMAQRVDLAEGETIDLQLSF